MNKPKVSVVIPVYNAEDYLERCVDSLRNQTLKEIEIILVDDGSPGLSPRLCDEMAAEDVRIKVIHKQNEGAGYARNSGLEIATGEYIGFVDSDDYVEPDMYKSMVDIAEKYSSDLVMTGVIQEDGCVFGKEGEYEVKSFFTGDTNFETKEELEDLRLGIIGSLPGEADDSRYGMSVWKNLFKRDIIEANGITFESEKKLFSEDSLFMVDYIACISKATGVKNAFYHYCRNGESISKSYKADRLQKNDLFIKKAEERYSKDIPYSKYSLYLNRAWQAICRVICSQEIMHAEDNGIHYSELKSRLREICIHPMTVKALKEFPVRKLPFKQMIFAYGMKYRMYFLLKVLVWLRR